MPTRTATVRSQEQWTNEASEATIPSQNTTPPTSQSCTSAEKSILPPHGSSREHRCGQVVETLAGRAKVVSQSWTSSLETKKRISVCRGKKKRWTDTVAKPWARILPQQIQRETRNENKPHEQNGKKKYSSVVWFPWTDANSELRFLKGENGKWSQMGNADSEGNGCGMTHLGCVAAWHQNSQSLGDNTALQKA